jgi:KDO2-lipid IV(A) lauroyltransferase
MLGYFETAFVWCRKVKTIPLELEGLEHYEKAKASGKGIIFITGHFTPLDLGAAILGRNFDIGTVYRRHNNALFNYFMTRAREQYVSYTIARKDFRGMVRHLRKGDSLIYLPDQDFGRKHSVFVPFFGIQTASIPTTTALAKTSDAIVLPVSGYRRGWDFKYVVNLEAPLNIPSDDSLEDTKVWNQWLEQTVRAHPDQYLWLHKRFKTRPEGEPSVYN